LEDFEDDDADEEAALLSPDDDEDDFSPLAALSPLDDLSPPLDEDESDEEPADEDAVDAGSEAVDPLRLSVR
jgi:hypothetical protein